MNKNSKISQENFIAAWENKRLIKGALKCAHVRPDYAYYDDLYQNAVILYAEMLENNSEIDKVKLDKLSFRKIIWHTLNQLHKTKLNDERMTCLEDAANLAEEFSWDEFLLIKDEMQKMEKVERAILIENIGFQCKMIDLNKEYNVHRTTLQRRKKKLLKNLREKLQ